jgi:hypothetical protein
MALKPFAFILCLPVAEHLIANRYIIINFIMRKRQNGTRLGKNRHTGRHTDRGGGKGNSRGDA